MFCLPVIAISGCTSTDINDNGVFKGVAEGIDAKLLTASFESNPLSFTFEESGGIDENLALDIGNAAIKSAYSNEDKNILKNTKFQVYELKDKNVYVVYRYYEDSMGGAYGVAISKKDGAIVKMWIDE